MRTFIFLCCATVFALSPNSLVSQHSKVKIATDESLTVDEVFDLIMEQTEYKFFYEEGIFTGFPKVQVQKGRISTNTLLKQSLSYGNFIIEVTKNNAILISEKSSNDELDDKQEKEIQFNISGTITDENNLPLSGANILEKGTANGTQADFDGNFSIAVESDDAVLVVSYIGFATKEVSVKGATIISVTLEESAAGLEEVVVIGYGTQKKVSLTSAVGQIDGGNLVARPVNSLEQALQGQLPGLTILDQGGGPGKSNTVIRVRGVTTIGNNDPLVIVDGIEQRYSDINPNDIESISLLKDASSSAIYGSRAANGVLLITTKRAIEGKIRVDYNYTYGIQRTTNRPESIELDDFFKLQKHAFQNVGSQPRFSDAQVQEYLAGVNTDPLRYPKLSNWFDTVLSDAPQSNHSISLSGGSENLSGRLSVRYQSQDGIIAHSKSDITEVRVNTDFKVSSKISVGTDLYFQHKDYSSPVQEETAFIHLMHGTLFAVPKYPDGTYGLSPQNNNALLSAELLGTSKRIDDIFTANLKGNYTISKGLIFTSQFAARMMNDSRKDFRNSFEIRDYYDPSIIRKTQPTNRLEELRDDVREYTLNNLLNYDGQFGDHNLRILLGYSQISNKGSNLSAYRQNFYNNNVQAISQGADDNSKDNGGREYSWGLRSYFGRLNYSFKDKYLFEVNSRYDGSSRFLEENRYSYFPSLSAGWRLSEEGFWNTFENTVNEFKLRGSWGKTGNQAVELYSYFPTLNLVNYTFNDKPAPGYVQQQLANDRITWETTTQVDFGFDAKLFNNMVTISGDYYKKQTEGILLSLPVPATLGLEPSPQNAGRVDNKGFELSFGTHNTFGKLRLDMNSYFAINENVVVNLAGTGPYIRGTGKNPQFITAVGLPVESYWAYKTDGLFQTEEEIANYPTYAPNTKPGDVKYLDMNNDGIISPDDQAYVGNTVPKYTFGSNINFGYKNLSLNILLQGAADVHTRPIGAFVEMGNFEAFVPKIYTDNYWTPENPNARFPRPTKFDLRNQQNIDRWVLDASYLRFKNIQLKYEFPAQVKNILGMDTMNFFVSGTNLITFSGLNEWNIDPELVTGYADYYPQVSVISFGVNLQF